MLLHVRRASEQQRRGGAGRHDDACRFDFDAVHTLVMHRNGFAQWRDAQRWRVLREASAQCRGRRIDDGRRSREIGLADAHVDHVMACLLEAGGLLDEFHDMEWRDLADA